MGVEIERKFKVRGDFRPSGSGTEIAQGYLSRDPRRTVRIRIAGIQGFLTIKGETCGATRSEYEYEIPAEEARELLALCDTPLVEKTRYVEMFCGKRWEVDIFHGANEGLHHLRTHVLLCDQLLGGSGSQRGGRHEGRHLLLDLHSVCCIWVGSGQGKGTR